MNIQCDPYWNPEPWRCFPHEDTPELMYHPVWEAVEVPPDLVRYWGEINKHRGWKALVCPCCRTIYGAKLAGVWGSFRAHVQEYEDTGGCFLQPARPGAKTVKRGKAGVGV